jgi:hypothetical protein
MKIVIETIPHKKQRYETVGDYWEDKDGTLHIRVSEMKNEMYNGMVAVHELVEFLLCRHNNITEQAITDFDVAFEKRRKKGNEDEPGFDNKSPYRKEHTIASAVELMMCAATGVSLNDYDKKVKSLHQ